MHSAKLLSAVVAFGAGVASAASSTCTSDVKVSEPTPNIGCDVVDGNVIIDEELSGDLVISGPEEIKGDLIINNATQLVSFTSDSIKTISGKFELQSLNFLSSLQMSELESVDEIIFVKLPQLPGLTFGKSGVTTVNKIQISDTFISDLTGLNVATVENFQIDNNRKLVKYDSDLVNITGTLIISSNGNEMAISMDDLEKAGEFQISNVKSFKVPALSEMTKSLKFDTNPELESFSAPNLTVTDDVSFINNKNLKNISMPELTKITGGFKIQNNTKIDKIDGFDKLETISGGISLRGNFTEIDLPAIKDVKGTVTVMSTGDIDDVCDYFDKKHDDGSIAGEVNCDSNNPKANEGGDDDDTGSGSDDSKDDDEGAAGLTTLNMAVLGLTALAGVAQLL